MTRDDAIRLARKIAGQWVIPGCSREDVEQEAIVTALEALEKAERVGHEAPNRYVRNRVHKRLAGAKEAALGAGQTQDGPTPADPYPGPLAAVLSAELLDSFRPPLLTPRQFRVIELSFWHDASDQSIADDLACSLNAIRVLKTKALGIIREIIQGQKGP